eukprot:8166090-Alexandrium_andersonii.AAC.1
MRGSGCGGSSCGRLHGAAARACILVCVLRVLLLGHTRPNWVSVPARMFSPSAQVRGVRARSFSSSPSRQA